MWSISEFSPFSAKQKKILSRNRFLSSRSTFVCHISNIYAVQPIKLGVLTFNRRICAVHDISPSLPIDSFNLSSCRRSNLPYFDWAIIKKLSKFIGHSCDLYFRNKNHRAAKPIGGGTKKKGAKEQHVIAESIAFRMIFARTFCTSREKRQHDAHISMWKCGEEINVSLRWNMLKFLSV